MHVTDETGATESNTDEESNDTDTEIAESTTDTQKEIQTTSSDSSTETTSIPNNWMSNHQPNWAYPMMNPNMLNPGLYMNPMAMMTPMMMSMMATMMNPSIYMNPMTTMNYPVNTMTEAQNLDAMMKSMDPNMMFGMFGQPTEAYKNGETPEQLPVATIPGFPTQTYQNWPKIPYHPASLVKQTKCIPICNGNESALHAQYGEHDGG